MMKNTILPLALLLFFSTVCHASDNPRVLMKTSMGDITLELDANKAPVSVRNFLDYVTDGSYEGTIFHRVIKKFMNQGGGFTADMVKKPTRPPITNEADNGLSNTRGTIAMARTNAPHSATNQFFINTVDNTFLDHTDKTMRGWGYTVFGKVVSGMDVMDSISSVKTARASNGMKDVPVEPIIIEKVILIDTEEAATGADRSSTE